MSAEINPYDAAPEFERPELPLWTKVMAVVMGFVVLIAVITTLGIFLFATLVVAAGRTQPSPIVYSALLDSLSQKLIFAFGGIFIAMLSVGLALYVVARILKSQRLSANARFSRRALEASVAQMQHAVLKQKCDFIRRQQQ